MVEKYTQKHGSIANSTINGDLNKELIALLKKMVAQQEKTISRMENSLIEKEAIIKSLTDKMKYCKDKHPDCSNG